jgi:hypothetical protein
MLLAPELASTASACLAASASGAETEGACKPADDGTAAAEQCQQRADAHNRADAGNCEGGKAGQ